MQEAHVTMIAKQLNTEYMYISTLEYNIFIRYECTNQHISMYTNGILTEQKKIVQKIYGRTNNIYAFIQID